MDFYDYSINQAIEALDTSTVILKKAETAPNSASFLQARIHEDMLPLSFQVHFMSGCCTKLASRLLGEEPPKTEDNLKSFADFYARIAETRAVLEKLDRETINSRATEPVTFSLGPGKPAQANGVIYCTGYAIPNIYFHLMTIYNILRKEGVALGKVDFLRVFLGKHIDY
ncbi:hypothetical protein MY11210_001658 [Beauveria gryllotalpidicola]